jgi:hypothetical protein
VNTKAECDALGGTWEGAGTDCDPDPCLGACCDTVTVCGLEEPGACTETYEDDCSGALWIKGVTCDPNPCCGYGDIVRCCLPDGTCNDTTYTLSTCLDAGGEVTEAESCTPNPCCIDDDDCATCECCDEGCQPAECPSITVDSASWCGISTTPGFIAFGTYSPCDGEVYCEDTESTITFTTQYFFEAGSLQETVACDGTQTTSTPDVPAKAAGVCRYIYRFIGGFGQGSGGTAPADSCKTRYWWGYIDVDPCAPENGDLTMVEDTAAAVNNSAIGDCDTSNTPGCRTDCDTDVDDCFSSPPVVSVSFAP